jgi:hypothetical protein
MKDFTPMNWQRDDFEISTDPAKLDIGVVHSFLTNCYWAKGIPLATVLRSIEHSLCFGVYKAAGRWVLRG